MSQRISKIALDLLTNDPRYSHLDNVAYGDDILHVIFEKANIKLKTNHPLNRISAVLNALDRESKKPNPVFKKEYFRSFKGLARTFTLINNKQINIQQL